MLTPAWTPQTSALGRAQADAAAFWAAQTLREGRALILDLETTGLDGAAEIVQVAVTDLDARPLYVSLVRPSSPIPDETTAIHGITDAMVYGADPWPVVMRELIPVLAGETVLVYNVHFDRRIITQECARHGLDPLQSMVGAWECVMHWYSMFVGEVDERRGLLRRHTLPCTPSDLPRCPHSALEDCESTALTVRAMAMYAEVDTRLGGIKYADG